MHRSVKEALLLGSRALGRVCAQGAAIGRGSVLVVGILVVCSGAARAEVLSIAFVHTHTGESIALEFKKDGAYIPAAVERLKQFLRDHRNGETHDIDPKLFDILVELRARAGSKSPFHLVSAYRSPQTNEMLRRTTSGSTLR